MAQEPDAVEYGVCEDTTDCTYRWRAGMWSSFGACKPGCGDSERRRTREVFCQRSDGHRVSDAAAAAQLCAVDHAGRCVPCGCGPPSRRT